MEVREEEILSVLGLTNKELMEKITIHDINNKDIRDFEEEQRRVIRTIIGILHENGGEIIHNTKDEYLVPRYIFNNPNMFIGKYRENYKAYYKGEEPII